MVAMEQEAALPLSSIYCQRPVSYLLGMAVRRWERRAVQAPPPTPIATGKGQRTAAVDDRVLVEYLESSLRVPELTLPESYFLSRSSPFPAPAEVELASLLVKDEEAVRRVLDEAKRVGAVRIRGGEVLTAEEVRVVLKELKRRELGWGAEGSGGAKEELRWYRPVSTETEALFQDDDTYRRFREKMESVASKLEKVAECIAQILSENVRNQRDSKSIGKRQSVLCLRKCDIHRSTENISDDAHNFQCHALSLCISGDDQEFLIHSPEGSASFVMPAGSIIITIRKQLQDWSNGEYKCAFVEPYIEESDDSNPSFFLEFKCSPFALDHEPDDTEKTISIMDQLLIVVALMILYSLWVCISSKYNT